MYVKAGNETGLPAVADNADVSGVAHKILLLTVSRNTKYTGSPELLAALSCLPALNVRVRLFDPAGPVKSALVNVASAITFGALVTVA